MSSDLDLLFDDYKAFLQRLGLKSTEECTSKREELMVHVDNVLKKIKEHYDNGGREYEYGVFGIDSFSKHPKHRRWRWLY